MTDLIPPRPLQRFCDLYRAIMQDRKWYQDPMALRYCALVLTATAGSPSDVARSFRSAADELQSQARWFGVLKTNVRFLVAADLVRRDQPVGRFRARLDEARKAFRAAGLPRNEMLETVALMILEQTHGDGVLPAVAAPLLRGHYDAMRANHRWITGSDDLPACALFAGRGLQPAATARRCEAIYDGLRAEGMGRGNAQQLASHIMCLGDGAPADLVRRFADLHRRFKDAGVAMWVTDYDELASLATLDVAPDQIVRTVLDHRGTIASLDPKPDRSMSFSLAAGTAVLAHGATSASGSLAGARAIMEAQAALVSTQAAIAATVAATTVVVVSASN